MFARLLNENRGGVFDLTRCGYLCIVNERSEVIWSLGDPDDLVFYRSASKPIQSLPVFELGLDRAYGLMEEESVVLSASHAGMPCHVAAVESILQKAGLREEDLCMKPAVPGDRPSDEARIRAGLPPRKVYHNCSGKHCALMLVQRALGGDVRDYWKRDSLVHARVERTIRTVGETEQVRIGVDGCGVPVFAVPVRSIATAYKNLACLDTIADDGLRAAAAGNVARIARYPHMIRGAGILCTLMNEDDNIIAKGGAAGVYGFGLKRQRLGVALKLVDGTEEAWPFLIREVLRALGALTPAHAQRLERLHPQYFVNDNDEIVGEREALFRIEL